LGEFHFVDGDFLHCATPVVVGGVAIQAHISGHSQGERAILGPSEEGKAKPGKQCQPVQSADAGSIEKHGIELAPFLVVGIAAVMRPTCCDSPHSGIQSAPLRSGLHRL
jgi:hypothetical protein